ncbi:hypothetical protein WA158_007004 [Blastocystis sp. Blastoise]
MFSSRRSRVTDGSPHSQQSHSEHIDAIPGEATFVGQCQTGRFHVPVTTLSLYPNTLFYEYYMDPTKRTDSGCVFIDYSEINMGSALMYLEGKYVNLDRKTKEQLEELKADLTYFRVPIPPEIDIQLGYIESQKRVDERHENMFMQCLDIIKNQMDYIQKDIIELKEDIAYVKNQTETLDSKTDKRLIEQENKFQKQNDIVTKVLYGVRPKFEAMLKDQEQKMENIQQIVVETMDTVEATTTKRLNDQEEKSNTQYQILEEAFEVFQGTIDTMNKQEENTLKVEKDKLTESISMFQTNSENILNTQMSIMTNQKDGLLQTVNAIQKRTETLLLDHKQRMDSHQESIKNIIADLSQKTKLLLKSQEDAIQKKNEGVNQSLGTIKNSAVVLLQQQDMKMQETMTIVHNVQDTMNQTLQCVVLPHPEFSFPSSLLLTNYYSQKLLEWTGMDKQWKLVYSGRFDGYKSKEFHRRCDNKGETILIVKCYSNKIPCIFGGYSQVGWKSTEDKDWTSIYDKNAFLFTLQNPHHIVPSQYKNNQKYDALRYNRNWGPCFNCGICISDDCNSNSYSHIMFDDQDPVYEQHPIYKSSLYIDLEPKQSKSFFKVEDIEVFIRQ